MVDIRSEKKRIFKKDELLNVHTFERINAARIGEHIRSESIENAADDDDGDGGMNDVNCGITYGTLCNSDARFVDINCDDRNDAPSNC